MPYPLHGIRNGFLIDNGSLPKFHQNAETLLYEIFQDLNLHLTHDLNLDLFAVLIPQNMKLGLLLFKLLKPWKHHCRIAPPGQQNAVAKRRRKLRQKSLLLKAQPLPRPGLRKPCYGTDRAGLRFAQGFVFFTGIDPDLIHLFLPLRFLRRQSYLRAGGKSLHSRGLSPGTCHHPPSP